MGMDAPTREDFSLWGTTTTHVNIPSTSQASSRTRDDERLLRLDFQTVVRRYARKGVLFASQETLAQALKNQYPLITKYVVARLIKQDKSLLRIGDYKQGVHGVPYLVLSVPSRSSVRRRIAVARRFLLSLVKKREKNVSDSHVHEESARYGRHHRRMRAFYQARLMSTGSLDCTRCGKAVNYDQKFHLDHVDGSDTEYAGIAHPWCNRKHQLKARLANWFKPNFLSPELV